MPDESQTIELWLKTRELAHFLNIEKRSVRRICEKKNYKTRKVKSRSGSDGWEIAVSSLPPEILKKIEEERKRKVLESREEFRGLTANQKSVALERQEILNNWSQFAHERGVKLWACAQEFLSELENSGKKVCRATLFNWLKAYKKGGIVELAPGKRAKSGVSDNTFSPEALQFLNDTWLTQNQLSIRECYNKLVKMARLKGWKVGSYSSAKRYCNSIPPDVRVMRRNGPKKFSDTVVPYIPRNPESLEPMQLIECDHHQLDVACRYHDGRIIFPWLTLWIDVRSWKPLGWCLCERPNSDSIAVAFYKQGLSHGLPKEVYLDNGKDFRSKLFVGRKKKKEEDCRYDLKPIIKGVFDLLKLKVHFALPYNAKAKLIENLFGILTKEFAKWMRGYRGRNVVARPEKLKDEIKKGNILSFDELKENLEGWLSYEFAENRKMWGKYHKGDTPNNIFYADKERKKRMVREDELMLMLTAHPNQQKVKQNGIWWMDRWYWSEKLHRNYYGKWVQFRVPPDNPDKIFVFDDQDCYIDVAERISEPPHIGITNEQIRKFNRMKKIVRENEEKKYQKLVPKPLTDEERESLAVDRDAAQKHKEPELPVTYINTRFREAFDKEKEKKINRAVMKKRQNDLDKRLRDMAVTEEEETPEKLAQERANKYLRDLYIED